MSTSREDQVQGLATLWWLLVLFGVVVLGVGVFFVVSPHETLTTFTVIAGILLLLDGVLAIVASIFGRGEGRGLLALVGALSAIAGLVLIKKPFDTLLVFVLIFGVWLIVAGVVRFVAAFSEPEGRTGNIVIALIDVIAGIVILSWPAPSLATLAVIIGIVLIFRGALFIAAGFQLRRLDRDEMNIEVRVHTTTT
ncbi:MAG: HdeD family acid-resistance protein [Solirubrobacteraceae bacterium]